MQRLNRQKRVIGLIFCAFAVWSFFQPLVLASPAVLGKANWSVFEILQQSMHGRFSKPSNLAHWHVVFEFSCMYVLLLGAFISLLMFPSRNLIQALSIASAALLFGWRYLTTSLRLVFYGNVSSTQSIQLVQLSIALLTIVVALVAISWSKPKSASALDEDPD